MLCRIYGLLRHKVTLQMDCLAGLGHLNSSCVSVREMARHVTLQVISMLVETMMTFRVCQTTLAEGKTVSGDS